MIGANDTSIDFGSISVGVQSSISVVISNDSPQPRPVDVLIGNDPLHPETELTTSVQSFVIQGSGTYTIHLKLKLDDPGAFSSVVKLVDPNGVDPALIISVIAMGVTSPAISAPTKVTFGTVYSKEVSEQDLVVQNNGSAPLNISNVAVTSGSSNFSVSSVTSAVIPAGSSFTFRIRFSPVMDPADIILAERHRTGSVSILSDASPSTATVDLEGRTGIRDGAWQDYNLSTLIPKPIMDTASQVVSISESVSAVVSTIKGTANAAKSLLISIDDPLVALVKGLKTLIDREFNDLKNSGVYVLPVAPISFFKDVNANGVDPFERVLASIGGGSNMFKQRIVDSFDDIYDGNRPQFSDSAVVGAVVIAADSGNFEDVLKNWRIIKNIFSNIQWKSEVIPPRDIKAVGSDGAVNLSWSIPDIFTYDIRDVETLGVQALKLSPLKFNGPNVDVASSLIDHFEIFSADIPGTMRVADVDFEDDKIKKGEVYRLEFGTGAPQKKKMTATIVSAASLFKSAVDQFKSNSNPKSQSPSKGAFLYRYKDSGRDNGKTRYYTIRTVMRSGDSSRLSDEVAGTPVLGIGTPVASGINRCANLKCKPFDHRRLQIAFTVPETISIDQKSESKSVQRFSFTIDDSGIQVGTLSIVNFDAAVRKMASSGEAVDMTGIDSSNFDIIDPVKDGDDLATRKRAFRDRFVTPFGKARPNSEVHVVKFKNPALKSREQLKVDVTDIYDHGFRQGDAVILHYDYRLSEPIFTCSANRSELDPVKCVDGSNRGICAAYQNKSCIFNDGMGCTNRGFTQLVDPSAPGFVKTYERVPNKSLFKFEACQDGTQGAIVNEWDRPFTNSPEHSVRPKSGICAGYVPRDQAQNAVGQFPDWTHLNAGGISTLFPATDAFIRTMQDFIDKQLGSVQSTADTVSQFIDLLQKRLDSFEQTMDELNRIIRLIQTDYTGAGFHVLNIAPATGGVRRIKDKVRNAQGGPDSGPNGFTAGLVILYGADSITPALISTIFGAGE